MKKKLFSLLLLITLFHSCSQPPQTENLIRKVETSLVNPVYIEGDSVWSIEDRMKHYGVPGVSIAVINNFQIEFVKSYGIMDKETKEPVTTSTLFQAGSISKPVAAYGALKLVEQKKFDLDTDVNSYLKSWKIPDNEFTSGRKITLAHLMSHTAGLTVHGFLGYSPDLPVPSLLQVLDGVPPANSDPIRVNKTPGESFRYSGGGYCIMQQMMIDVEGKPFPEILKETVFKNLRMNNSTYNQPLDGEQLKMAATGYLPDGSQTKGKRHTYPEMAAAGLWTTAEDLAKFLIDIQHAVKGESNTTLSQEMTNKMLTPNGAEFIGLGMFLNQRPGNLYFGHGGWDEGFSSEMVAHKEKGYGVVVLTNANQPQFIDEVIRSVAMTYNWSNYLQSYKRQPVVAESLTALTGRYKNNSDGMITVTSEGDRLFMKYIRGDQRNELIKINDSCFVRRDSEDLVMFKANPTDGKLHILFVGGNGRSSGFVRPRLDGNEKIPYEYLLAGNFDQALKGYQALMKADPNDGAIIEGNLNRQGYDLLRANKFQLAKDVFKVNVMLYPNSSNVYDSYAEACMKNGDIQLAIENYKKSLVLDPNNTNAKKMIAELASAK